MLRSKRYILDPNVVPVVFNPLFIIDICTGSTSTSWLSVLIDINVRLSNITFFTFKWDHESFTTQPVHFHYTAFVERNFSPFRGWSGN